jgi:predicted NodU family carbamoyl transferase
MAKLQIEELVSGLLEAAIVAKQISERQHINALANYFDDKGNPISTTVQIGDKKVTVPFYSIADHTSIGLDEMEVEFDARLGFDTSSEPSKLKQSLLGKYKGKKKYKSLVKNIEVDHAHNPNNIACAKIKVKFKKDDTPEAVSRMVDEFITQMGEPTTPDKK